MLRKGTLQTLLLSTPSFSHIMETRDTYPPQEVQGGRGYPQNTRVCDSRGAEKTFLEWEGGKLRQE